MTNESIKFLAAAFQSFDLNSKQGSIDDIATDLLNAILHLGRDYHGHIEYAEKYVFKALEKIKTHCKYPTTIQAKVAEKWVDWETANLSKVEAETRLSQLKEFYLTVQWRLKKD